MKLRLIRFKRSVFGYEVILWVFNLNLKKSNENEI